jgi:hypothetical protein
LQGLVTDVGAIRPARPAPWLAQHGDLATFPGVFVQFQLLQEMQQVPPFVQPQALRQCFPMALHVRPDGREIGVVKQREPADAQALPEIAGNGQRWHAGLQIHHHPGMAVVQTIGGGDEGASIDLPLGADEPAVAQMGTQSFHERH